MGAGNLRRYPPNSIHFKTRYGSKSGSSSSRLVQFASESKVCSTMKNATSFTRNLGFAICLLSVVAPAIGQQKRPAITGISHMCVYSSDAAASEHFYAQILGATKDTDPQNPAGTRYYFSP